MSAASFIHQLSSVHLITDGAEYAYDGTILGIGSKVVRLPEIHAAYTIRGSRGSYKEGVRAVCEAAPSFEALLANIGPACEVIFRDALTNAEPGVNLDLAGFELTIIGYSDERGQPEGWTLATYPKATQHDLPGYEPYKLQLLPAMFVRPGVPSMFAAMGLERPITMLEELLEVDPVTAAAGLLVEQRKIEADEEPIKGVRCVGGFGELTTVTAKGVSTIEVIRWDDTIGEAIGG